MSNRLKAFIPFFIFLSLALSELANAQLIKDLGRQLEIPNITNLQSSDTHFYALSESEGLVVFRASRDSLQWLYSSTGMQQRGHILEGDIRFAYLYGDTRRLTVIEPTSVLGVYSSTVLPDVPRSAKRIGNDLFIALGNSGFGRISLETPESVDAGFETISEDPTLDLVKDDNQTLFVLNNRNQISIYTVRDRAVSLSEELEINQPVSKLFLVEGELIGADSVGNIYLINSDGDMDSLAEVENAVDKISTWNGRTIVRTENADLWFEDPAGNLNRWKSGEQAGNYFTVTEDTFWISEFNKIAPILMQESSEAQAANNTVATVASNSFQLKDIEDVVLPYPRPLLLPIEFQTPVDPGDISISYTASFDNAQIRGQTFYWQPTATQSGRHSVKITASLADGRTDSTQFVINLRPFNSPPRFTPARAITIPTGEAFELRISAIDPDGLDQSLIRYLGVDMPNGGQINEQTGIFKWNPSERQVGKHTFRIIATDQYGAAASQDYTLNVIEMPENSEGEDMFDQ